MQRQVRPKTGFKQKNEDFSLVNYDDIEKYADLLYEEKYEDKVKGARNILFMISKPDLLEQIAEEKQNIFDIFSRTLREEHKKTMELTIVLLAFFRSYSFYKTFHPLLLSQSIGEICMSVIDFQFMKYEIRRDEIVRFCSSPDVSKVEYQNALQRFLFLVLKQDRILNFAFGILLYLAEEIRIEYKMVKKDIVALLMKNMDRREINLLLTVLLFLKKLSIFQVNKDVMVKSGILDKLFHVFEINNNEVIWEKTFQIIFNLSFDHKFRMRLIAKPEYFNLITKIFIGKKCRTIILRILYNLSLEEKSMPLFYNSDCLLLVNELLIKFPEKIIGAEIAALALNLIVNKENANKLGADGRAKKLIERALKNSDFELIKIVKNIIKYADDEGINDDFYDFIDDYFLKILTSKTETQEFLIEVIEILSYVSADWEEKLEKFKLIDFFEKHLNENKYDDLTVAVIMFLGNVSSDHGCGDAIANSTIIPLLYSTFSKKMDNYSVAFGVIFILYQLMAYDSTQQKIVKNSNFIQKVIDCLRCPCQQIKFITTRFLELVQLYDAKWDEAIKARKFESYNAEIIQKMRACQQIYSNMEMMQADYDDDDDDIADGFDYDDEDDYFGHGNVY